MQTTSYYRRTREEMPALENYVEVQHVMRETNMLTMSRKHYHHFSDTAITP